MRCESIKQVVVLGMVAALITAVSSGTASAQPIVETGWDLFTTTAPTTFAGVSWEGVPLGDFDFGGAIGVKSTGDTDTIVERLDVASVPLAPLPATAATIDIEMVALQLKSANPVDLGAGSDFHYITLDPVNPSTGEMTITFDDADGGTFDSFIDVDFDVRFGALNGTVIFSDVLQLSANDVPWDRISPLLAILIPGVNHLLNGVDNGEDFWPTTPFTEEHPEGAEHTVETGTPEPAPLGLLLIGGLALLRRRW